MDIVVDSFFKESYVLYFSDLHETVILDEINNVFVKYDPELVIDTMNIIKVAMSLSMLYTECYDKIVEKILQKFPVSDDIDRFILCITVKIMIAMNSINLDTLLVKPRDIYREVASKHYRIPIKKVTDNMITKIKLLDDISYNPEINKKVSGWDEYFYNVCVQVARNTKCFSRRIGAVLVNDKSIVSCYDNQTEILTNTGFKFFKDLISTDLVATLDKELCLEFNKPHEIINQKYSGEMYLLQTKYINQCVTPNHKMFVSYDAENWRLEKAEDVYSVPIHYNRHVQWKKDTDITSILLEGFDSGNQYDSDVVEIPIELWLEFLGYYLSEGFSNSFKNKWKVVVICTDFKDKHREDMLKCCEKMAFILNRSVQVDERGRIKINDRRLYDKLVGLGKCHEKYIPREILNLPSNLLNILLDAMIKGDGHVNKCGGKVYITVSSKLADDVQELALKCGYSAIKNGNNGRCSTINGRKIKSARYVYWVSITKLHLTPLINVSKNKIGKESWISYTGNIYCVNVKNHVVLVRREGRVCWSGNTGYNGPPRGVPSCDMRWKIDPDFIKEHGNISTEDSPVGKCPRKYLGFRSGEGLELCPAGHAERNSLINAARNGIKTKDTSMYMSCGIPCTPCLVEIINAGVKEIVVMSLKTYDKTSMYLLNQSKINVRLFDFIDI